MGKPAVALAVAGASGVLLWLSGPLVGAGALAWVAIVPAAAVSLAAEGRTARAAVPVAFGVFLELSFVAGMPFGIAENQWGKPPLPILVGESPVVFAALVWVPVSTLALYALRFPQPLAGVRSPAGVVLVPAAAWTALDFVRVALDPSGLWGPLFLTQQQSPTRLLAALAGPWGVTFALVATNYALAVLLVRGRPVVRPATATFAAVVATVVLAPLLHGGAGRAWTLAGVQPGYDTTEWDQMPVRFFDPVRRDVERAALDVIADLGDLSRNAVARGADVVVWPEAAIWVDPAETDSVGRALARLARELEVALVVPSFQAELRESAARGVDTNGRLGAPKPKQRPMWFLGEEAREEATTAIALDGMRVGALLGIDNEHAGAARTLVRRGAEVLGSSTHDWRELAMQQRAFSSVHAAALARPLVRSDWRYGSAIYDARGRRVADLGLARARGVVVARVETGVGRTPYAVVGDAFAWACLAAFVALWSLSLRAGSPLRRGLSRGQSP